MRIGPLVRSGSRRLVPAVAAAVVGVAVSGYDRAIIAVGMRVEINDPS